MKEAAISTEALNSYGVRVLTAGIELSQFERNPVLLWMHRRGWEKGAMPIGRIENIRTDGDKLIGTPVFDQNDEFAKQIESKWENGFLRMLSAGLEIIETSADPSVLLPGQERETVTRSKLVEVSVVDIGSNDEAIQLYEDGKLLRLASGEENARLPLLKKEESPEAQEQEGAEINNKPNNNSKMIKEQLSLLGLPENATEEQATAALQLMKHRAENAETIELAAVTQAVDQAVKERRILAEQRDHFIKLGKTAGLQMLADTLASLRPQQKPNEVINLGKGSAPGAAGKAKAYAKLSDVPADERLELRKSNPAEYKRLFKEEYGMECPELKD